MFLNRKTLLSLGQNNVVSKKHLGLQIILKIHSAEEVLRLRVKFTKSFFWVKVSEKHDLPHFHSTLLLCNSTKNAIHYCLLCKQGELFSFPNLFFSLLY